MRRILVFNLSYVPGFRGGGPVRTLANMVGALGAEFDFRVITLDRDAGMDRPYASITPGEWQRQGDARVLYLARADVGVRRLLAEIGTIQPDLIYLNSFLDRCFTLRVLVARRLRLMPMPPVLLAPRGEFSPGALQLKAALKQLYRTTLRSAGCLADVQWQASSDVERRHIENATGARRISVVPNLVISPPALAEMIPDARAGLRVCYLARITPMKNLGFALNLLADVPDPITLRIFGPIADAGYWRTCQSLIAQLPRHITVSYEGEVAPAEVASVLAAHDVLCLPTRGENFGHVIHEALSVGTPVLISDRTPWNDLEAAGVGWVLPLESPERYVTALLSMARMSSTQRQRMRARAVAYANARATDGNPADRLRALLHGEFLTGETRAY